jgi:catechol 2,3-dioxygenase-like lactoylglutathione lyase family enzyme
MDTYTTIMPAPTIDELLLADDGARWAELGFAVSDDCCELGRVRLRFLVDAPGRGIIGWSLRDLLGVELDGLATTRSEQPLSDAAPVHPNGVVAIDHIVAMSPSLDRSVRLLRGAGLDLRRIREQPTPAGAPRQAFFRLGAEILELIQEPTEVVERTGGGERPARFWGLAVRVEDLDRTVQRLGDHAGPARAAVQPGRRIATVRRSAGLAIPLALMSAPAKV